MTEVMDLTGKRFGRLVVIRREGYKRRGKVNKVAWLCECDCGTRKVIVGEDLRTGITKGCGCLESKNRLELRERSKTHGMTGSDEYKIWAGMIQRCVNPKRDRYASYGGRGIKVCERWRSFENFIADMGRRPGLEYTLDRVDTNGDYEPGNCRWATRVEQMSNTTRSRYVEYGGKLYTVAQLARLTGMKPRTLYSRLDKGMAVEDAIR